MPPERQPATHRITVSRSRCSVQGRDVPRRARPHGSPAPTGPGQHPPASPETRPVKRPETPSENPAISHSPASAHGTSHRISSIGRTSVVTSMSSRLKPRLASALSASPSCQIALQEDDLAIHRKGHCVYCRPSRSYSSFCSTIGPPPQAHPRPR